MNYSKDGLVTLTEQFEGCRLVAYQDQVGVWTIGYGHTKNVKQGDICTQAQAEAFLLADVQECVDGINAHAKVQLTQRKFDALVDFAFNLGLGALEHSTLWKKLNAGDFAGAAAEFPKWDMAGGKHVSGLLRRRKAEQAFFSE
jgi:lysozyme